VCERLAGPWQPSETWLRRSPSDSHRGQSCPAWESDGEGSPGGTSSKRIGKKRRKKEKKKKKE